MAEAAPAAGPPRVSRLDRRKARTRQALIDAAVRLIAEGRGDRASIAEITEEADIGFGSFDNHFDSKEQLFQTASEEVLERWGQLIDQARAGLTTRPSCTRWACGSPDGSAGPTPASPGSSPAPAWTRWTSRAAWRHVPCATSAPGRPRAGSPSSMPRSRSAPWPAACSGCCGCASGTPNASRRPRRPARRRRAAPARRPRRRSRPPRRPPAPSHRYLVTAARRRPAARPCSPHPR